MYARPQQWKGETHAVYSALSYDQMVEVPRGDLDVHSPGNGVCASYIESFISNDSKFGLCLQDRVGLYKRLRGSSFRSGVPPVVQSSDAGSSYPCLTLLTI